MHHPHDKISVKHYSIDYEAEGYFECILSNEKRIDIAFYMLHKQILEDNYKLGRVLNKYQTWEEEIDFLLWTEIDLIPYMNAYIDRLITTLGSLEDILWVWDSDINEWVLE